MKNHPLPGKPEPGVKRVSLDAEKPEVRRFIRNLPIEADGVELELNGRVVCKVVPSLHFSEAEKEALVRERWELIRRAQRRAKGLPPKIIEREVQEAVDEVRGRKKR